MKIEYFYRLYLFSRQAVKKKKIENKAKERIVSSSSSYWIVPIEAEPDRFAKEAKSWREKEGGKKWQEKSPNKRPNKYVPDGKDS